MNFQQILVSLFVVSACNFVSVWTEPAENSRGDAEQGGQQYSITFIPAIHSGDCRTGEVWYPKDIQCAMCRCIANRFSRCIPRPGCVVTVTTTTSAATESTPTMKPQAVEEPGSNGQSNNTNFIYFVPAIHRGECTPGTVWHPEDTQCARCRCIFNTFSRCIPTPGCQPTLSPTIPTTTTEMTSMEAESSTAVDMGMDTSDNSTQMGDISPVTENANSSASANSTSSQTTMAGNTTLFPPGPNRSV